MSVEILKARVKKQDYPYHSWLTKLSGQIIDVYLNSFGSYVEVRNDDVPGCWFDESELDFNVGGSNG